MTQSESLFHSLVAFGAASLGAASLQAASPTPPNILFILADDMGRGDLSVYNRNSAWQTPSLDQLAREGVRFNDAHSSSAVCTPSRYSILTGRYNWRSRIKSSVTDGFSAPVIEEGRLTVPGMLQVHGYSTAMIGKWHLGLSWATQGGTGAMDDSDGEPALRQGQKPAEPVIVDYSKPFGGGPAAHGFQSFLGISASLDMPPYVWLRDDHAVQAPTHEIAGSKLPKMWRKGPESDDFAHVDVLPRLTAEAVGYLSRHTTAKPFFLYLALTAPHTPIVPAKEFEGESHTTPYGDFCVQVDHSIGQVLKALAERHLADHTLVVFMADNGCSPSANFEELKKFHHDPQVGFRGEKADIYEGGHRVPFIVRWPGHARVGETSEQTICGVDFLATCAEVLDLKVPDTAAEDSVSFLPALTDPHRQAPLREALVHHSINGSFAIRQGDWKLCLCPDSGGWSDPKPGQAPAGSPPFQLFNLASDPGETTNLYARHPEIVRRLGLLLKRYVVNGRSTPGAPQKNTGGADWPQLGWMNSFND